MPLNTPLTVWSGNRGVLWGKKGARAQGAGCTLSLKVQIFLNSNKETWKSSFIF